jgi:hypothetical protein
MPAHPDFVAGFAAGLADGKLPPGLTATDPAEAPRRFAVYRNNVAHGLGRALAQRFPVIERLVGPAFFAAMARVYCQAHRPQSPVLLDWGDRFPGFLAEFPPLAGHPYMADVARIEYARGRAYHAADADRIAPDRLIAAARDPGAARLGLHPAVQVLRLDHPAVSIWAANQPDAPPGPLAASGAEIALVLRTPGHEVPVRRIDAGDAALIEALADGRTLGAAAAAAAAIDPAHDPQSILVHLMQSGCVIAPKEMSCPT